jgi:hypothetical protein
LSGTIIKVDTSSRGLMESPKLSCPDSTKHLRKQFDCDRLSKALDISLMELCWSVG